MLIKNISNFPNTVYHGTITRHYESLSQGIDISKSNIKTDFGQGFYTTFSKEQAESFAETKAYDINSFERQKAKAGGTPNFVNPLIIEYKVNKEKLKQLNGVFLDCKDDKWAEFVYNNRIDNKLMKSDFHNKNGIFDYVFGDVADTKLFPAIKKYSRGLIDFKQFQQEINPYKFADYNQLSFHTEEALNCLIKKSARIGGI